MENHFTPREQIVETANKLFVYTDSHQWKKMQEEVFTDSVLFDMSPLGGGYPDSKFSSIQRFTNSIANASTRLAKRTKQFNFYLRSAPG